MIKQLLVVTLCSLGAICLRAQTEPEKSPAQPDASRPPTVHDASHAPKSQPPPVSTRSKKSEGATTKVAKTAPAFDAKNMDKSVKPGADFFSYANGGWCKRNPIPPEYARWGTFNELIERNNDALHTIAEKAAKGSALSEGEDAADVKMVGDFYASGMDEKKINATGIKPLQDEFDRINAMKDTTDLVKEIGHLHSMGVGALFGFTSGQDDKNSTMIIAQAYQDGTRHAGPRLLHEGRRRFEEVARKICRALDENVLAPWRFQRCRSEERENGDGYRNIAGQGRAHPRGAARSAEELQQDAAGRSAKAHAGL